MIRVIAIIDAGATLARSSITQSASIAACARGTVWEQALWLLEDTEWPQKLSSEMFTASSSTISACEAGVSDEAPWLPLKEATFILTAPQSKL